MQSLIEKNIKQEIKNLTRIKDTFDERYDYLRLDKNERLLPFPEKALESFRKKITSQALSGYGELGFIYRKLAKYLHVQEDQLLLASGSDLAIKSIYEACICKNDGIILHAPCYAMYKVYGKMYDAQVKQVFVNDQWKVNISEMLRMIDPFTKFFVIENPNGFVGTKPSIDELEEIAKILLKKNIIFLIDEAYIYIENTQSEAIPLIHQYPNVLVSQTFSKGHGLAGARAGYLVGNSELIEFISRVRPMHEITSLTALSMEWVLDHPEYLTEFQKSIQESKAYLKKSLKELSIQYKDTYANFMLLYLPNEGATQHITEKLKEKKILVRRPFEELCLKGWSRVCVGSLSDSQRYIEALQSILNQ